MQSNNKGRTKKNIVPFLGKNKIDVENTTPLCFWVVVGTALRISAVAWCPLRTGPVYVSMFKPLAVVVADVIDVIFLGQALHLRRPEKGNCMRTVEKGSGQNHHLKATPPAAKCKIRLKRHRFVLCRNHGLRRLCNFDVF
ncbi:unnamed protein product [Prunus armeniaca]